jgi:hypothetical protein
LSEALSFLDEKMVLSIFIHIFEFRVNHGNLSISQRIRFSIDQTFDGSKLIDEHKLWIISMEVDSFEISLEERIIKDWAALLINLHINDSTAYLEEILNYVIGVSSVGLQVRLNEQVLLRFLEEGIKLLIFLLKIGISIKEM